MKKNENVQRMSPGQLLELGAAVLKALPQDMSPGVAQGWIGNSRGLRKVLRGVLMPPVKQTSPSPEFLKLISGGEVLALDALDGKEILANANDAFAYIDPDFKKWGADECGVATGETAVEVHELVKDGTFAQFFGIVSDDASKLCFTQAQIRNFCIKHRNWLRKDGYATLFLFKSYGHFFVAYVHFYDAGTLPVYVLRFEDGRVWRAGARPRLVLPQLAV